jgi:hypothetical protein
LTTYPFHSCECKFILSGVVELSTDARIRQMHRNCTLVLGCKIVIMQCNMRATVNVVMTSHLTPVM